MRLGSGFAPQPVKLTLTLQGGKGSTCAIDYRGPRITAAWSGFGPQDKRNPAWVDTHKGIPNLIAETKPDNPCKVCSGRGKVVCGICDGKGTKAANTRRRNDYRLMSTKKSAAMILQAGSMDYSIDCCQVGCGPSGAPVAEAAECGTVKGDILHKGLLQLLAHCLHGCCSFCALL